MSHRREPPRCDDVESCPSLLAGRHEDRTFWEGVDSDPEIAAALDALQVSLLENHKQIHEQRQLIVELKKEMGILVYNVPHLPNVSRPDAAFGSGLIEDTEVPPVPSFRKVRR